jgi:hypothetical protein
MPGNVRKHFVAKSFAHSECTSDIVRLISQGPRSNPIQNGRGLHGAGWRFNVVTDLARGTASSLPQPTRIEAKMREGVLERSRLFI